MNQAMERGNIIHRDVERVLAEAKMFASTSKQVEGALWRDLEGVTHVIGGWDLMSYDQFTCCGMVVRYRRHSWLYEVLGLAPTFSNCISCAGGGHVKTWTYGTVTGRMSFKSPNIQPMPPRKR